MPIFNQPDDLIHLRARKFPAAAAIGMLLCNHIRFYSGHFLNKEHQVASMQPQERAVAKDHILFYAKSITFLHITCMRTRSGPKIPAAGYLEGE